MEVLGVNNQLHGITDCGTALTKSIRTMTRALDKINVL